MALLVDRDFFQWSLIEQGEAQVKGSSIILREYERMVVD